jgi:hypothetical protein
MIVAKLLSYEQTYALYAVKNFLAEKVHVQHQDISVLNHDIMTVVCTKY